MESRNEKQILDTRGAGHDAKSFKAIALLTTRRIIAYLVLVILSLMSAMLAMSTIATNKKYSSNPNRI